MTNGSKLLISLIITLLGIGGFVGSSIYKDNQYVQTKRESEYVIDSLKNELLVKNIVIGTYEDMWERLVIEHPEIIEKIKNEIE
jgi:hypothetical protein